jgi:hypothetical protein
MRWTGPLKTTFAAGSIATALVTSGPSFYSTVNPYPRATTGYDVSYPQCPGVVAPDGAFGIVGVNGGKAFTYNPCLSREYKAAPRPPSLYINTGYAPTVYRKSISANCSSQSTAVTGTSEQTEAWAIGCSEAESSLAYARRQGATNVAMWWLDVETANSWSETDLTLNRYAIQGAVSRLIDTGVPVGIYAASFMWTAITGGNGTPTGNFTPTGIAADWVAAGNCNTPFTDSPVWLVQSVVDGIDRNFACPL